MKKTSDIYKVNENIRGQAKDGFIRPTVKEIYRGGFGFNSLDKEPYDEYTKLILHMDGTDNGTIFTDDSASNHIVTPVADAKTKTDIKQFGTASGYFDGDGDYLTVPDSEDFGFGSDDFTIDMWINANVSQTVIDPLLISNYNSEWGSNGWALHVSHSSVTAAATSKINFWCYNIVSGYPFLISTTNSLINDWIHVAIVRYNNRFDLYINGISESNYTSDTIVSTPNSSIYIGGGPYYQTTKYKGFIDELRISKGISRWTGNFTPPVVPYS